MALKRLGDYVDGFEIIANRSTVETVPEHTVDTGKYSLVRLFFDYEGTVSSCNVRLWFNRGGLWYRGATTSDGDALTGADEARDFDVKAGTRVGFTVEEIAGGGSVAVAIEGVA